MDVRLRHVVAVAKSGSFTRAAEIVGVTQSAVTRGVADLERQLGFDLFHRTSRGAVPTERGKAFADRASRLLDDERDLLRGEPEHDPFQGTLRIGVAPASLEWSLGKPIASLKKRRPNLRFEIVGSSFERMVPMLRDGSVDIAVGLDDAFRDWGDLRREQLFAMPASLFVRNGHPLLALPAITKVQLVDYEFVSPSDSRPYGAIVRTLFEEADRDWRRRIHVVDSFPIAREIVGNSDAIGVIAASRTSTALFRQRFRTLGKLDLFAPAVICCAHRINWQLSGPARAFITAMRQGGGKENARAYSVSPP